MEVGSAVFNREQFDLRRRPSVYEVFTGDECTYVGYAGNGFDRFFHIDPKHQSRYDAFMCADRFVVTHFETNAEAAAEEERLIHERHPRFNNKCAVCYADWVDKHNPTHTK